MTSPPQPSPPLHEVLAVQAQKYGARVLAEFDDRNLSYMDLYQDSLRIASGLQLSGVGKGEPVMMMLGNRSEYLTTFFATAFIGAIAVPVNTALKGEALAHLFRTTDARHLIIDGRFMDRFTDIDAGGIERIFIVGEIPADPRQRGRPFADLLSAPDKPAPAHVGNADPWSIMFTSGTTGVAKGVILSHQQIASAAWDSVHDLDMDETSVFYTFNPLFHLNGLVFGPMAAVLAGGKTVVRANFPRENLLPDLCQAGATHWVVLPFMVRTLLSAPERPDDGNNALRIVLTLGLTEAEIAEFQERFGCRMASGYGSTEAGMICRFQSQYPTTAGRVSDRYEMRIVDQAGKDVPDGETGEIWVRPRQQLDCMLGYYHMPEATAAAFSDGWFKTGDLGYLDGNQCLNFIDRLKDSLKRRGENISTFEVEKAIMTFPGVHGVAVVGHKQESGTDEEVRAFIELSSGAKGKFDYQGLIRHCSSNLAYFMVPRFIDLIPELPRTSLGKIEKEKLKILPLSPSTFDVKASGITVER